MLNEKMDKIESFRVLERAHPAYGEPTLGTLLDHVFYYVANSPWSAYDADGELKQPELLKETVVLKRNLK
jgi:hypothetical protein